MEVNGKTNVLWFTGNFLQSRSCMCALSLLRNDTFPNVITLPISAALEPAAEKPFMHYSVSFFSMCTCRSRHARRDQQHVCFFFFFWSTKSSSWLNNLQAVPCLHFVNSLKQNRMRKYSFCSFSRDVQKNFQYSFFLLCEHKN